MNSAWLAVPLTLAAPLVAAERLAVAALVGLAVGTEREWSEPPAGPQRRFAGLRTFLLLGMLGGVAGLLLPDAPAIAGVLLAGGAAFAVVAYAMAVRRPEQPLDGTTEAAALVVLALGTLAAIGQLLLAAAAVAVVVFALGEKQRLHRLVGKIGPAEMHAALQFLILALVVLPLLPSGPIGGILAIRPRALWALVLLLSGINFATYIARRALGPHRGYGVAGVLGGLFSSTVLTMQFSRLSRREPEHADALALGTVAASAALPLRVLFLLLVLNRAVAAEALFYVAPALLIGVIGTLLLLRRPAAAEHAAPDPHNPLRLGFAMQIALILGVVFLAVDYARTRWGSLGIIGSSALFGLADLDALTASMAHLPDTARAVAARGVGVALAVNTITKCAMAAIAGERRFRREVTPALAATTLALAAALWWRW